MGGGGVGGAAAQVWAVLKLGISPDRRVFEHYFWRRRRGDIFMAPLTFVSVRVVSEGCVWTRPRMILCP